MGSGMQERGAGRDAERLGAEKLAVKVLIVDDDEEDIYLIKRLLGRSKRFAYRVRDCRGLDEGMAVAAAEEIDLLLVDFFLGIEIAVDTGREKPPVLSQPFVLLSGLDAPELNQIAREAGALAFLCKGGLTVEAVDDCVRLALDRFSAPTSHSALGEHPLDAPALRVRVDPLPQPWDVPNGRPSDDRLWGHPERTPV
jgi:CheY-like chemotaxis protein